MFRSHIFPARAVLSFALALSFLPSQAIAQDCDLYPPQECRNYSNAAGYLSGQWPEDLTRWKNPARELYWPWSVPCIGKRHPDLYEARYFYARHCFAKGELEKAAGLYAQASAVQPDEAGFLTSTAT